MSVNRVILIGNVGRKPEMRYVDDRLEAYFTLATNEKAFARDGSPLPEITEWHRIIMRDGNAKIAERYIDTGTKLYIEGKLRTRTWQDRNAIKRTVTEILVDNFDFLGRSTTNNPSNPIT